MQKKIILIGNTAWGMWKFRADLIKELIHLGHKVIVIAPQDDWAKKITSLGCTFIDAHLERKGTNPLTDLIYLAKLLNLFFEHKPDIVLSYTIKPVLYGSIAARLAGVQQIVAITTGLGFIFSKDTVLSKVIKTVYRFALCFSTQVWFLNEDDRNTFLSAKLVTVKKTFVLPGEGVDINYFKPVKVLSRQPIFTLVSRLLWDKGVGVYADCAKELKSLYPNMNFQILGIIDEGNPEGIPETKIKHWNSEGYINYLGSADDIRPILEKSICIVHPTFYKEGVPRILMEASSMGIPCITTNIAGCRDVVQDGITGFLVEPNDKEALKKAILKLVELDEFKQKLLGLRGRERVVQNFSSERINSIYRERLQL